MAITTITLKNGERFSGAIDLFRPSFGWLTLFGIDRKFCFEECKSIITKGERVSINSPLEGEDCDEIERARKILKDGRKYHWTETDENYKEYLYPRKKFEWEKNEKI